MVGPLTGCDNNEDPAPQCQFDGDCIQKREKCDKPTGQCIKLDVPECAKQADCFGLERCQLPAGICVVPMDKPEMSMMDMTDMTTQDMPKMDMPKDMPIEDQSGDRIPPKVTNVSPNPQDTTIAADQTFTVTFSEPIDPISVSEFSVKLKDSQNTDIELTLTLSNNDQTLTIKPNTPLARASGFTLILKQFLRDPALNNLDKEYTYNYVTEYVESAEQRQLAEKWAPYIYQGIKDATNTAWRSDIPSTVDFDGDFRSANNKDNLNRGNIDYRAHVYYHVTSSKTHHFLYYILYYPTRTIFESNSGKDEVYEHDMTGAVFVIDRGADQLVFVEGVRVETNTDQLISYALRGSGYDPPGELIRRKFDANTLEDTSHYPMYIPAERHEACNWHDEQPRPPLDLCKHPQADFPGGKANGVILKPGMPQALPEATTDANGYKQMTYALVPFASTFWLRRSEVGSQGLFSNAFVYKPEGSRQAGFTADGPAHLLPTTLSSNGMTSYGKTPFQWLVRGARNNAGQWMIDPAYELRQRYTVPGGDTSWSQEYCDNLFMNISTTCP